MNRRGFLAALPGLLAAKEIAKELAAPKPSLPGLYGTQFRLVISDFVFQPEDVLYKDLNGMTWMAKHNPAFDEPVSEQPLLSYKTVIL